MAAECHPEKITFERHIIECCIVPYLCMYLVCRIHFRCYFFNSRTNTAVICIFQDGRRIPSRKITFERHIIECCIVPYLCMYLVCRIHFWCYFFNSRTNTAVICIFQDGRRIPSRKITFERHIIECCIIPHLYMYLVCRIHFWCYFFNSRSTLAVIYIFQDGHQIHNGV